MKAPIALAAVSLSVLSLGGCAIADEVTKTVEEATKVTFPDQEACDKWVEDYNNIVVQMEAVSEEAWFAGEGARLFRQIADQEEATAALAKDQALEELLLNMAAQDRGWAADLDAGTDTTVFNVEDADIYERCYELGIQTLPRNPDGTLADFYVATVPTPPLEGGNEVSEAEKDEVMNASFEAVQSAYYDCFPAVAAGMTINDFIRSSPTVSTGVVLQDFTPDENNPRSGIVTIFAGEAVLEFQTKQRLNGEVVLNPLNQSTISILDASECTQHDY